MTAPPIVFKIGSYPCKNVQKPARIHRDGVRIVNSKTVSKTKKNKQTEMRRNEEINHRETCWLLFKQSNLS